MTKTIESDKSVSEDEYFTASEGEYSDEEDKTNKISSMVVIFNANSLTISLLQNGNEFIDIAMSELKLNLDMKRTGYMSAQGYLASILVNEKNNSIWSNLVEVEQGKKLISFNYQQYPETLNYFPGYGSKIDLSLATIKFIYINSTIIGLSNYFTELNQMLAIFKSNETPNTTVVDLKKSPSARMKMSIEIQNPQIIIPKNNKSSQFLVIDLGVIQLKNKFENPFPEVLIDNMSIQLSNFYINFVFDGYVSICRIPRICSSLIFKFISGIFISIAF